MQIDKYTKFLLTVIACCLVYLCLKDAIAIPKVHAEGPMKVLLVDSIGRPVSDTADGMPLPVRIDNGKQ
ncbi:MAG TPA: hypothetical protein VG206_27415 [Terriglobia bacterium]|nr:hypothetical protein [Terriglobia bacterium]